MSTPSAESRPEAPPRDFIREIVAQDLGSGKHREPIVTRFPPEPNGRLHIGHAKAICIDFGVAQEFGGRCNLRFDDTNPVKESQEYVDEIERDIRWLGFDWGEHLYHASDYFEQLYQWAEQLIRDGKAYVDSLTADQMREYRGTLTEPGRESPYRNRSVDENLDLFRRMRAGEFADGEHVLRAKIDMASGNINMRDPVMYRIRKTPHQRTGDRWVIYPMYDWAHGQSDYIEGVTYSLCSLEYEDHRPLYDWYLDALGLRPPRPRQIEFARLNLNYTVMSKRMLLELVEGGHVSGWDDPRMPTLSGLRRRGYTPESIRNFCDRIGVAKRNNVVDIANLEHAIREDLNLRAPRVMAVLNPVKVVIENYPEGHVEEVDVINNPEDPSAGTRKVPFSRELFIERDDFMENPPEEVLPAVAGQRSAAALRLFHQVHRGRERSGQRGDRRAQGDLRPGDTWRGLPGRPQGESDAALGVGHNRARCRGAHLRSALHPRRSGVNRKLAAAHQPPHRSTYRGRRRWSRASPRRPPAPGISSSVSDISASILTRPPGPWCSTARFHCAIPGPRSPRNRALRFEI